MTNIDNTAPQIRVRALSIILYGFLLVVIVVLLLFVGEPSSLLGLYDYQRELRYRQQLETAAELVTQYHLRNSSLLEDLANNSSLVALIDLNATAQDIRLVEGQLEALVSASGDYNFLRFLDHTRERLWFSSHPEDIIERSAETTHFAALSQLSAESPSPLELISAPLDKTLYSPTYNSLIYRLPVMAKNSEIGLLALYAAPHSLTLALRNHEIIDKSDQVLITPRGLLLNGNQRLSAELFDAPLDDDALYIEEERLVLLEQPTQYSEDTIFMLIPESQFKLTRTELFSYGAIAVTSLFLLLFFLLHIHQSPQTIIEGRMNQFRKQLVTILKQQRQLRDSQLLRHLTTQRDQLYERVTRGIAPRRSSSASIERIFKQAWMELLAYLYLYGFLSAQNDREPLSEAADSAVAANMPLERALLPKSVTPRLGLLRRAMQFRPKVVERVQGLYQISQKIYNEMQQKKDHSSDNPNGQIRKLVESIR